MGAALFPPGLPSSLLPLEGALNVMNFLIMTQFFGRPSLSLEVAFSNCYEPLTGVVLTVIAFACHYGDAMGSTLLSRLATLSTFPDAFDGGHGLATAGSRSRVS
jgi:hypothetical protein